MNPAAPEYEALRRLLVLKRHEQPPPGHFDFLHRRIMTRVGQESPARVAWWEVWLARLDVKPALAGALGLAVGAAYFFGLTLSGYVEQQWAEDLPSPPVIWASQTVIPWQTTRDQHSTSPFQDSQLDSTAPRFPRPLPLVFPTFRLPAPDVEYDDGGGYSTLSSGFRLPVVP